MTSSAVQTKFDDILSAHGQCVVHTTVTTPVLLIHRGKIDL